MILFGVGAGVAVAYVLEPLCNILPFAIVDCGLVVVNAVILEPTTFGLRDKR